jgi:hypothetical protein
VKDENATLWRGSWVKNQLLVGHRASPQTLFVQWQLALCPNYPRPHRPPLHIASLGQLIRTHCGLSRRLPPVLLNQGLGGAVDVEVGDPLPSMRASIA